VARAIGPEDEVEGLDEEFLYHLSRGSDLLAKGEAEAAKASLERAAQLRPRDSKVLGLLGQAAYRLGRFEESAGAYGRLVDDNPVEAAARVNLGLACLKAKRYADAVKQLGIALDLNPDHKKAMGYLGLAHFESGNVRAARDWFARAGSELMVARCDEVLASSARRPDAVVLSAAVEDVPEPIHTPVPGVAAPARLPAGSLALAAWAAGRLVSPLGADPFASDGRTLAIAVRGEVLARLDGLFAARGALQMSQAMKRFRGRATDKPFGEGVRRMHRVTGEGMLLYRAGGRRHTALDLGGDAGYFREEVVFALEESVVFENGRVPSKLSADLDLVHLRGRGHFLLATEGEPVAVEVGPEAPLRVPLEALVGWVGALTPKVVALLEPPAGAPSGAEGTGPVMVELTGEGRAIVDPSTYATPVAIAVPVQA
jgi:tetratricopeptide (TPR) repeat protein